MLSVMTAPERSTIPVAVRAMKRKRKFKYAMCRPIFVAPNKIYVRFYSTDPWPWYQVGVICKNRVEAYKKFHQFAAECEQHRRAT